MTIKLKKINNTINKCKKCPRLVSFIKKISIQKRKQNKNEKYWGKPVPGFGDNKAKLMILDLTMIFSCLREILPTTHFLRSFAAT